MNVLQQRGRGGWETEEDGKEEERRETKVKRERNGESLKREGKHNGCWTGISCAQVRPDSWYRSAVGVDRRRRMIISG